MEKKHPAVKNTESTSFGWVDYWRMLLKRGPRLPLCYFINAHLFDLIHGTDTHEWVPKDRFVSAPRNFEHGVLYMTSWTYEIRRSFQAICSMVGEMDDYAFLDIGCGKGKVVLVWQQLLRRIRSSQAVYGVEYYEPLVALAQANHYKCFADRGKFIFADATRLNYDIFGRKLILYLYNPFNEAILTQVLMNLEGCEVYVIYNNPVHSSLVLQMGYVAVYQHRGFHANCRTTIYRKPATATSAAVGASTAGPSV